MNPGLVGASAARAKGGVARLAADALSVDLLDSVHDGFPRMVIRFFGSVRSVTGATELEADHAPATLGELLHLLSDQYGSEFRRWVLDGEELSGSILIVVNGDDVRHRAGLATPLAAGDVVSILPIMAGGIASRS